MRLHLPLYVVPLVLFCSFSVSQRSTVPAAKAVSKFTGLPENPPFFSAMTAIWQGDLQYEDIVEPKGPVARVERKEVQSTRQNQDHPTATLKFDDEGHLIERIDSDSTERSTTIRIFPGGKLQSETVEHHSLNGARLDSQERAEWSYDDHGRLSDFRTEEEHYLNFKYDSEGRLLGCESNSGESTEISYAGNTVTISTLNEKRQKSFEEVKILDSKKRVIDLRVSEFSAGKREPWYHVRFRYDWKGRVIEQTTDPFNWGDEDDYSPLPGKLTVLYDDENHSGEEKFYDPNGKLVFHARFQFDRDGVFTKLRQLDASGREIPNAEDSEDPHTGGVRPGKVEWEVIYDDHDNWIERRRWFTPAHGNRRILTRVIRQEITYR